MSNWFSNLLPAIENAAKNVGQTAYNVGQAIENPIQTLGHAALPKIIPQTTPLQNQQAQAGAEFGMAPYSLADPANATVGSAIDTGATAATPAVKAAIQTGKEQPGGLQAGFVKIPESNGGKYVNENTDTPLGGTPAKVKAKPIQPIKFKYTPPQVETEIPTASAAQPTVSGELPPITSEPSATLSAPARPSQPGLTATQKIAQKLNGLNNYQLPASYGENRPNLEAQDKSVMQNVVGGNTANQVLQKANAAKTKIWNQVESAASQHPAVSTNGVLSHIKSNLDDLVNQGIITQAHANNALIGEQKNLTQGGADITGNGTITGNQLVDLRTGANAQNKGVPYGSTNPIPYIRKAIADGYSDAMGNLDPNINNLYQQYSSVKRIGGMSDNFRNQSLNVAKIPGTNLGVPFTGAARRGLASAVNSKLALPIIGSGLLTAGVAGGYLGAKMNEKQSNASGQPNTNDSFQQHKTPNSTIISQPYSNIKPDSSGHFDLSQNAPTGSRTYMSENDYQNALSKLTQQYPAGGDVYNANKTLLDSQYANDQAQATNVFKGNGIMNFMDNVKNYNDDGNSLYDTFNSTALGQGFWNGVAQAKSIGSYTSQQYTQELQQISAFDKEFSSAYQSVTGETPDASQLLSAANSPSEAGKKWASMMQFINGTYSKYQAPYLALTSSSGAQTNQGTGQTAAGVQNGTYSVPPSAPSSGQTNIGVGPSIIPLPTIQ